ADLGGEREHVRVLHRLRRERIEADATLDEPGGEDERRRELRGVAVRRPPLGGERLPQAMHRAFGDLADELLYVRRLDALGREPPRAVDVRMRHGAARVRLEGQRLDHPALGEVADQRVIVALRRVRETVEEAVHTLEYGTGPQEARTREQRRPQARLRRPARMHALGPGPFGEIFDDAGGHAAGDAERIDDLLLAEPERSADAGGRAHGAED